MGLGVLRIGLRCRVLVASADKQVTARDKEPPGQAKLGLCCRAAVDSILYSSGFIKV